MIFLLIKISLQLKETGFIYINKKNVDFYPRK